MGRGGVGSLDQLEPLQDIIMSVLVCVSQLDDRRCVLTSNAGTDSRHHRNTCIHGGRTGFAISQCGFVVRHMQQIFACATAHIVFETCASGDCRF